MLASLSGPLLGGDDTTNNGGGVTAGVMLGGGGGGGIIGNSAYLGHIIHVINAAQQAGIVVGRRRS
eukprot:9328815-Ditylum_brightwellii.AAC.1